MTTETLQVLDTVADDVLLRAQLQTATAGLGIGAEVLIRKDQFASAIGNSRRFLPTNALAQTFDRASGAIVAQTAAASATQQFAAIHLVKGMLVTTITFVNGATAGASLLNQWFSLSSSARVLLGVTNDDTSTAWAANAAKTLTLAEPYLVPATGLYYLGVMVKATTVPTLLGHTNVAAAITNGIAPILAGTDATNSALTNPASAPATAAALTAGISHCYAYVS